MRTRAPCRRTPHRTALHPTAAHRTALHPADAHPTALHPADAHHSERWRLQIRHESHQDRWRYVDIDLAAG